MLSSIKLNREFCFRTVKIENVIAHWMFSTKLIARKPSISNYTPQPALRYRHDATQSSCLDERIHKKKIYSGKLRAREKL
jgi:hypothetical protein